VNSVSPAAAAANINNVVVLFPAHSLDSTNNGAHSTYTSGSLRPSNPTAAGEYTTSSTVRDCRTRTERRGRRKNTRDFLEEADLAKLARVSDERRERDEGIRRKVQDFVDRARRAVSPRSTTSMTQ